MAGRESLEIIGINDSIKALIGFLPNFTANAFISNLITEGWGMFENRIFHAKEA